MGTVSESEKPREAADFEKWIGEAREGKPEALGRLLDICRHYLLLVANQELTPAPGAKVAPSDIVQNTLLEAGRHFPRFHGSTEEELLAWLRGILRNNVANVHRHFETEKRQLAREVPLEDSATRILPQGAVSPTETPSMQPQARERDEQLEKALLQLPDHYRQVLFLHTTEELTFAQIAEKLGRTPDAVRKLWGRAVDELAKLLESPHESA
jgi:RNA polymerase sigma-70 factor (ECF subfamily)